MKGLDNWLTGGNYHKTVIECKCPQGHTWEAPGYVEYGSTYFKNEDVGPICPECNELDIEVAKDV